MVQVYQLKNLPDDFKILELSFDELLDQVGAEHLMTIYKQRSRNTSLLSVWGQVKATYGDVLGKDRAIPDVSIWANTYLVLNGKAYTALNEFLKDEGEFLPINIDGESAFIFNCLSFGKEDETMCAQKYLDGIEDGLETLIFEDYDVSNRYLFKSKLQGCQALYATEKLKKLCHDNQLSGLRYELDLLAIF